LLEVRFPVSGDLRCEDGAEALVRAHAGVEIAHQPADEGAVDERIDERHFRLRADALRECCSHVTTPKWYSKSHINRDGAPSAMRHCRASEPRAAVRVFSLRRNNVRPAPAVLDRPLEEPTVNFPEEIDPDMTVDEIMRRWPATIRIFLQN